MRQEANTASSREVQKGNTTAEVRGRLQNCWKSQVGESRREWRIQGKEKQNFTGFQPKVTVCTSRFFIVCQPPQPQGPVSRLINNQDGRGK